MPAAELTSPHDRHRRLFLIAAIVAAVAFVVVATLVRARAGGGLDGRVVMWFEARRREPFTTIAVAFDRFGKWWLLALVALIFSWALWASGRMVQAVYLVATLATSLGLNAFLKIVFQRQPPGTDSVVHPSLYAFPSGHTMTTTAIMTALAVIAWPTRWRWVVAVPAAVVAVGMGVSRVYLGAHWPSDVAAGLALGFGVALTVRVLMPWPTPEEVEIAQGGAAGGAPSGANGAGGGPAFTPAARPAGLEASCAGAEGAPAASAAGIDVVFLDWGNTLMVDNGMREGPMKDWDTVEAEAGAQVALRRLRDRYRLIVATNAVDSGADDVRQALARVGLADLVHDVISSADIGDHKPHYAFYRSALLCCGRCGLPLDPRRAVMVGDGTTNDIAGAQQAGLYTIWYNPTKRRFPAEARRPDAEIDKLIDLPDAVDRLAGVQPPKLSRQERKALEEEAKAAAAAAAAAEQAAADLRAQTAAEQAAAAASRGEETDRPEPS